MRLLVLLLAACLVAGCTEPADPAAKAAGATGGAASSRPPPEPAPEPSAAPENGAITGLVIDDEQRPISHVAVVIVQTLAEAKTDADGRFTFNDLVPGDYGLILQRPGYEEASRKVAVVAGEVAEVKVTMEGIPLPEGPYHLSIPKRAYIKASWVFLTSTAPTYNSTGLASTFCDPCRFHLEYPGDGLVEIKPEAWWAPFAAQPAVNEDIWLQFFVGHSSTSEGDAAHSGYVKNGKALAFPSAALSTMAKHNSTRLIVHGALLGINLEHKPEVWTTFAYGDKLPAGFTALPPP